MIGLARRTAFTLTSQLLIQTFFTVGGSEKPIRAPTVVTAEYWRSERPPSNFQQFQ